jgi:hypothetical protein
MLALSVAMLAATATYHYPKLLLYPLAAWTICWYMERPGTGRAAAAGLVTAAAFLFRHDHGVYVAAAAVLGFALTRLVRPESRNLSSWWMESGVAAVTALAVLTPWLILVHTNEGLAGYVEARLQRYAVGSPYSNPYASLLVLDPVRMLTQGTATDGMLWLQQMALLVPMLSMIGVAFDVLRARRRGQSPPLETYWVVVAAAFLALIDWRQFREPGYVTGVAPLTAALAARLLVAPGGAGGLWKVTRGAIAIALLIVTSAATFRMARDTGIFTPWTLAAEVPDVFGQLFASPPIDGFAPPEEVARFDRSNWNAEEVHLVEVLMRYVHDCTAPGDRVLVTGQTPFQVGYYLERPIAGGQLFWHEGWRSDPARERQSLELLQHQSVPFAYSTHDPVLDDFRRYPNIRTYLAENYLELEGSRGLVLIDRRRQPSGEFGALGFPCFNPR